MPQVYFLCWARAIFEYNFYHVPLFIYKNEGETPLEALDRLRHEQGIGKDVSMTYAGRLDPMAEGLLVILVGEECKRKPEYTGLDKEYEIEVLLGIGSDTGDILGIVTCSDDSHNDGRRHDSSYKNTLNEKIQSLIGKRSEKYPPYSSKPLRGKPLFMHARAGELDESEIPEKNIEIYAVDVTDLRSVTFEDIYEAVTKRIKNVSGDFRQELVMASWGAIAMPGNSFSIVTLKVSCSSGSYMRTLAQKVGEILGTSALAWKIKRTKVGEWSI